MSMRLKRETVANIIAYVVSGVAIEFLLNERVRAKVKGACLSCKSFFKEIKDEGAKAFRTNKDRF